MPEREKIPDRDARRQLTECLRSGRVIEIRDEIFLEDVSSWRAQLQDLAAASTKPILIYVNSFGGDILAIQQFHRDIDRLREDPRRRVYTLGEGHCRSAGVHALLLGHPDGIYVRPNTEIQLHGSLDPSEFFVDPEEPDIITNLRRMRRIERGVMDIRDRLQAVNAKGLATLDEDAGADRIFTPLEALDYGLIDGIFAGGQ